MSRVAAIGDGRRIDGLRLAGVLVLTTDTAPGASSDVTAGARDRWACLPHDVGIVILTPDAAEELRDVPRGTRLTVVMPP